MERFVAITRRVGNSAGILIPGSALENGGLAIGQEVEVTISPRVKEGLFGRFRGRWVGKDLDDFVAENKDGWGA